MKAIRITLQALLLKALGLTAASAQKVQVGYDESTDVSKFTTYTWAEPGCHRNIRFSSKPLFRASMKSCG